MIAAHNPLAILHANASFARVLARIVGETQLFPTADELGGLNVHVYGDGDELGQGWLSLPGGVSFVTWTTLAMCFDCELTWCKVPSVPTLGWHYDNGEWAVTVMLQCPGESTSGAGAAYADEAGAGVSGVSGLSGADAGAGAGAARKEGKKLVGEQASVGRGGEFAYATGIRPLRPVAGGGSTVDELSPAIVAATVAVGFCTLESS
jgi:hypothetical protein